MVELVENQALKANNNTGKSLKSFNKFETMAGVENMKKREKVVPSPSVPVGNSKNMTSNSATSNNNNNSNINTTNAPSGESVWRKPSLKSKRDPEAGPQTPTPTTTHKFSSSINLSDLREPAASASSVRRTNSFRTSCRTASSEAEYRSLHRFEGNEKTKDGSTRSLTRKNSFRDNKSSFLRINGSHMALNKVGYKSF